MLICKDRVISAMNLTVMDISNAFRRAGYLEEVFTEATYLGYNGHSFVYEVTYLDEGAELMRKVDEVDSDEYATSKAKVYIKFEKQEDGSFALVGEY